MQPFSCPKVQGKDGEILVIETDAQASELLRCLSKLSCVFGLDLETTGVDPSEEAPVHRGTVVCWSLAWDDADVDPNQPQARMGPRAFLWKEALEVFRGWLADPAVQKVGHNLFGFDKHVLSNDGFELNGIACDTLRAAQLANAGSEAGLKSLIGRLLGYAPAGEFRELFKRRTCLSVEDGGPAKSTWRTLEGARVPTLVGGAHSRLGAGFEPLDLSRLRTEHPGLLPRLFDYTSLDARATLDIYYRLRAGLTEQTWVGLGGQRWGNLWEFYKRVWHPMLQVLYDMVRVGCAIDEQLIATGAIAANHEAQALLGKLRAWVGDPEFNPGSPQQLTRWLYDTCNYPVPPIMGTLRGIKKTPQGKRPTAEASLDWLAANGYGKEHIDDLRSWRKVTKLGQFLQGLPGFAVEGRVHSIMGPETITGRPTSKKPNLLNIPKAKSDPFGLRKAFVAPPGSVLVVGDYAALEPRIAAHWASTVLRDSSLRRAIDAGDIYAWIASQAWPGAPLDQVRDWAKIIFLARAYGKQSQGLSLQLAKPLEETKALERQFDRAVPAITKWQRWTAEYTRKHYGIRTLLGRFIPLPAIHSESRWERQEAERAAVNYTCQASAADIMYCAMLKLAPDLKALGARMLLSIYDELVIESPEPVANQVAAVMKTHMESPFRTDIFSVPLKVEPKVVPNWGLAK